MFLTIYQIISIPNTQQKVSYQCFEHLASLYIKSNQKSNLKTIYHMKSQYLSFLFSFHKSKQSSITKKKKETDINGASEMDTTPRHENLTKISQEFRYLFLSSKNRRFKSEYSIHATRVTETGTPIRGPSPNPLV